MRNDGGYDCVLTSGSGGGDAAVYIGAEGLEIGCASENISLNYAELKSFGLLNYKLTLNTTGGELALSKMGHDTEGFYKELSAAYNARAQESLFAKGAGVMDAEGDYACADEGGTASGTAVMRLLSDCILLLPSDAGARRIPLCFTERMEREDYRIDLTLDTGEKYSMSRMGRDTIPLFEKGLKCREAVKQSWEQAMREVEGKTDELSPARDAFLHICGQTGVILGLFEPNSEIFWMAGVKGGCAAVELFAGEKAATFLYRFDEADMLFPARLRHAMEAMGTNREVINLEDDALKDYPLYRMSIERSPHLTFLRRHSAGRLIHTEGWNRRLEEFFR